MKTESLEAGARRRGVAKQVTLLAMSVWMVAATPLESPVADAAMKGDVARVRQLLASGADVSAAQGDGMTALHWAADRDELPLAQVLIGAGANVAATTRLGGYTALHLAAQRGSAGMVEALVEAGSDARAGTETGGVTPLHFAAAAGSAGAIAALIDGGAEVDVREVSWGQTPLMFAAAANRIEAVEALLDRGADPAIAATVLDIPSRDEADRADQQRRRDRVSVLRSAAIAREPERDGTGAAFGRGAPSGRGVEAPQGRGGFQGASPSAGGPQPLSQADLIGSYGGLTALLLAARDGHVETALTLIDRGADIDQRSAGDRTTPLLMATINGHFDLAKTLFERGADPTLASDAGATPLYTTLNTHWIPKSRHPQPTDHLQQRTTYLELMRLFLEAGVDPNVRLEKQLWFTTFGDDYLRVDRMGATPFWRAAYALDVDAMKLLVSFGADPHVPTVKAPSRSFGRGEAVGDDPSGLPPVPVGGAAVWPIHAASGVGYGEGFAANIHRHVPDGWLPAVRYLVEELGADVTVRDHNGYNAVHHAAARGDNELILYLVERGADVTAVSRRGQTTADMANGPVQRISPFLETVALLESLGSRNNHNCVSC